MLDIISAVGGLLGGIGGITGIVALRQSHKGNKLAENANRIAKEANGLAVDANKVAADANEIGEHANTIANRALDAGADQTVYQWAVRLDAENGMLSVINDCALDARDVHVVIRSKEQTIADARIGECAGFSQIPFECQFLVEEILKNQAAIDSIPYLIGSGMVDVDIHIVWTSELGVRRSHDCKKRFSKSGKKQLL